MSEHGLAPRWLRQQQAVEIEKAHNSETQGVEEEAARDYLVSTRRDLESSKPS